MTRLDVLRKTLSHEVIEFLVNSLGTEEFEVVPLAGDASTRRYYRVVFALKSWVLMSWEPFADPAKYPFLNVLKHLARSGVQVPEVLNLSPRLGLVLLEDLGDLTLERKFWEVQNQELVFPFYQQAIDELIKIHYAATANEDAACSAFQISFDTKKFLWEMNYGREHVIEKLNQITLSESSAREIDRIFTDVCTRLDQEPKFISHRDYHSRNLMLKLGKMRVIDFQDARLGPIQYDLVSLIFDSYVSLSDVSRGRILEYYLACAKPHLPTKFSRAHFEEILSYQVIQRCFKACGSFASFLNLRNDRRYIKYIQPTVRIVAHELEKFPDYKAFRSVLVDNGLLERKYEELCTP